MTKYHAIPTTVDGITFASKAEGRRYAELVLLEKAGLIRNLELQPKFPVMINGRKGCTYKADFCYDTAEGRTIEDVKGVLTPIYRLKKKLVEASYPGVKITEVVA